MKQKNIVITGKLSLDAEDLIREYFAVKRVKKIEGFIVSEEEFINRHQGTYAFQELLQANYHAVYKVKKCDVCWKPFKVVINDRKNLYDYIQSTHKFCRKCNHFRLNIWNTLSDMRKDDMAS